MVTYTHAVDRIKVNKIKIALDSIDESIIPDSIVHNVILDLFSGFNLKMKRNM